MAYSELIKNFSRIRDYMRDFYVYGFKSRREYAQKSARSYDNERRRVESWLGDHMAFKRTASGKNVFFSIDARSMRHNPLYKAFKAKSFTDGDITLHFLLFDLLQAGEALTLQEVSARIDGEYLARFDEPLTFDESTLRKKLKEYTALGLIETEKAGRTVTYRRCADTDLSAWHDALAFFAEAAPCGVLGSYLVDREAHVKERFAFKHHYINHALESEVLYALLDAIGKKHSVTIENFSRRAEELRSWRIVPLKIYVSVQSGRQYVLAYNLRFKKTTSYRLDYIKSVTPDAPCEEFDALSEALTKKGAHMWGVVCDDRVSPRYERVTFTVHIGEGEEHIYRRLEREKRCGRVERIDPNTARFSAEVYDTSEMLPWIRTFLCRITDIRFSNPDVEAGFYKDIDTLCEMYGIGGERA